MNRKKHRIKWILAGLAVVLALGIGSASLLGLAVFEENQAVHINPREIEDSTLLIGTHLIYLGAFNDQLYEAAVKSQETSGQQSVYYKSELSQGAWYEISSASSISDITEQKKSVSDDVIAKLFLTHHTKSDGITYDLRTRAAVSVYQIYPAYDLEALEELSPIKNQYDLYKDNSKMNAVMKRDMREVRNFFASKVTSDKTEACERNLSALERYLLILKENSAAQEEIDVVSKIMAKVDAERRAAVYRRIQSALSRLSERVSSDQGLGKKEEFVPDAALSEAVGEGQANIESSLTEQEANMLSEGTTFMAREEYILANGLITAALEENHAKCDAYVTDLIRLYHITEGEIRDAKGEITLLDRDLTPLAEQAYAQGLAAGEPQDYRDAAAKNASRVVLDHILTQQTEELHRYRGELQFYIEARVTRCAQEDARTYVDKRLELAAAWGRQIPRDGSFDSVKLVLEEHIAWLQNLLAQMEEENGNHELAVLYEEKQALQSQRLSALDKEDLETADKLEAMVQAKDQEIADLERKIAEQLQQLAKEQAKLEEERARRQKQGEDFSSIDADVTALENRITALTAGLAEGSALKSIQEEKDKICRLVEQEGLSSQEEQEISRGILGIEGLIAGNPVMAGQGLKDIYQKMAAKKYLKDTAEFDDWMDKIEEIVGDNVPMIDGVLSGTEAAAFLEEALGCQLLPAGAADSGMADKAEDRTEDEVIKEAEHGTGDQDETGAESGTGSESGGENETGGSGTENETGGTETGGSEAENETGGTGTAGSEAENETEREPGSVKDSNQQESSASAKTSKKQAAVLLALSMYCEQTGSVSVKEVLTGLAQSMGQKEESCLFRQINKSSGIRYASAKAAAVYAGYRYLWNDNRKKAILASGKKWYGFYAFQKEVQREGGKRDQLEVETAFSSTVYLPEDYTEQEFGCQVYELFGTDYALLTDEQQIEEAAKALDLLLNQENR